MGELYLVSATCYGGEGESERRLGEAKARAHGFLVLGLAYSWDEVLVFSRSWK